MDNKTQLLRGMFPDGTLTDVKIKKGKVVSVKPARKKSSPDIGNSNALFLPTLLDIQVNGAGGIDLLNPDLCVDDIHKLNSFLAKWGVSQWVPTLVTAAHEAMEQGCRIIAEARKDSLLKKAIPGIHLEGPYISREDGPRGAHPLEYVRNPRINDFKKLWKASEENIIYTTLSPELPGASRYIRSVTELGCVVSLGHHNAGAEQIKEAVDAGARLSTHLGNGAHPQMQRHINPLWPQLAEDRLMASMIADLHHLPPEVLKTFVRVKGADKTVLVSDSVHLAGMKPGKYTLFDGEVELLPSGKICIPGTQLLAGSGLMLVQGVLNTAAHTDLNLKQAISCATRNPAKLLGIKSRGRLPKPDRKADFMLVSKTPAGAEMHTVFIDGVQIQVAAAIKRRTQNQG